MHLVVSWSLLITVVLYQVEGQCPNDLQYLAERDGASICVLMINRKVSYCEAHRLCAENHNRSGLHMFLIGRRSGYSMSDTAGLPHHFTSINSLYNARPDSSVGWRVGDPRHADYTTLASDNWRFKPMGDNRIVVNGHRNLYTAAQSGFKAGAICQLYPFEYKPSMVEKFKSNWPAEGEIVSVGDTDNGCWSESNANSKIHCAFLCKRNQQCRSFYYNEVTKQCRQSLYVDSSLFVKQINPLDRWVRFGRPFWGF